MLHTRDRLFVGFHPFHFTDDTGQDISVVTSVAKDDVPVGLVPATDIVSVALADPDPIA